MSIMQPCSGASVFSTAIALIIVNSVQASTRATGVTHEDIRDAVLSFAHMFRDTTDKLERHEYRERQLGEQLKKILAAQDKRGRAHEHSLETVTQLLGRLDERLGRIESALEKGNGPEKASYTVDTMHESIQSWMTNIETLVRNQTVSSDRNEVEALAASLNSRIDLLSSSLERLESIMLRPSPTASVTDIVNYEGVISRFEDKLSQLKSNNEENWKSSIQESLVNQERLLHDVRETTNNIAQKYHSLPSKYDLNQFINNTREDNEELKHELTRVNEREVTKLTEKLDTLKTELTQDQENIYKAVTDAGVVAEGFYADVQKSYDQLLKEVKALNKVEQVLIQTADNVLDTKRRIEYGVHQILLEVGDLVKVQAKDLNTTVNKRFDDISETIVVNHNGGFNNLSSKIETEISQVWRQIGIMYQQLTASAGALDRLQEMTETYVNGSLQTMDSMEGKVGQITGRMSEVDDNLNYLLGRLSLVTQEFGQIKTGLGAALDNIRSSFLQVQDKVKEVGPGPNPIESGEGVQGSGILGHELDNKV